MLAGRARTECRSARFLASAGRSARRLCPFGALLRIDMPIYDNRRRTQVEVWSLVVVSRVTGGARKAAAFATAAGLAALDLMTLGVLQHRNSIGAHWAVCETAVSFFRLYFERGRGTPQRARLARSALVGGEEKKVALASQGEVANARAGAPGSGECAPNHHCTRQKTHATQADFRFFASVLDDIIIINTARSK